MYIVDMVERQQEIVLVLEVAELILACYGLRSAIGEAGIAPDELRLLLDVMSRDETVHLRSREEHLRGQKSGKDDDRLHFCRRLALASAGEAEVGRGA